MNKLIFNFKVWLIISALYIWLMVVLILKAFGVKDDSNFIQELRTTIKKCVNERKENNR